jgi:TATA-box binding protein (TBP) (component of TFIID and TFIIIB)
MAQQHPFSQYTTEYAAMLQGLHASSADLHNLLPSEPSIATMTLEMVVDIPSLDLTAAASAICRSFDFDKAPAAPSAAGAVVHWRGTGFSLPRKHRGVCMRGKVFGSSCSCLCLSVATSEPDDMLPWTVRSCHAKVFKSGHVKLMGCRDYLEADIAAAKLISMLQDVVGRPVSVVATSINLINCVFAMSPFCKNNTISKRELNDLARHAGFHVHSGAGDGKPYIKLVMQQGPKALVYVTGKVWVTGCKSVADLGSVIQTVLRFVDENARQLACNDRLFATGSTTGV